MKMPSLKFPATNKGQHRQPFNSPDAKQRRHGFTLLELLVVISIIAVLMSLILPAIQNARSAARRVQCQNNLKNIAVGMAGYTTKTSGKFPSVFAARDGALATWATEILPHVDSQSVFDRFNAANPPDIRIPVFVCPDDDRNETLRRGLSYVVNVGYGRMTPRCGNPPIHEDTISHATAGSVSSINVTTYDRDDSLDGYELGLQLVSASIDGSPPEPGLDWDADGIVTVHENLVTTATGIFWASPVPTNQTFQIVRLDRGDGTSQTLMLSERDKLRDWANPPSQRTVFLGDFMRFRFLAPLTSHGFGISTDIFRTVSGRHLMPKEGVWNPQSHAQHLQFESMQLGRYDCPPYTPLYPRRMINSPDGLNAPPMSRHVSGANVAFCDGAVTFMSEDVAPDVYARLLTSAGTRFGEGILSGQDYK